MNTNLLKLVPEYRYDVTYLLTYIMELVSHNVGKPAIVVQNLSPLFFDFTMFQIKSSHKLWCMFCW